MGKYFKQWEGFDLDWNAVYSNSTIGLQKGQKKDCGISFYIWRYQGKFTEMDKNITHN